MTHCPNCGQDGAFDGQGFRSRSFIQHSSRDGRQKVVQRWAKVRCPDCGQKFQVLDSEETQPADRDDDDDRRGTGEVNPGP